MRYPELAEKYHSQPVEIFHGDPSDPTTCIKKFADSGVHFREITIETPKGGEVIEIDQVTDVHFNYCNEKDLENEELAYTVKCRKWLANAASVPACGRAMEAAKLADLVVVTGDTLDYLTEGAIELMHRHIWDVDPDALITPGGHDVTRQMQTGIPNKDSIEDRYAVIEAAWKHDVYYESRTLGDKVIAVALDNGQGHYWPCQVEKFAADLARARAENLVILIFEHEPICTGNPADIEKAVFREYDKKQADFYHALIGGAGAKPCEASETLYRMITENADIVRGVFCGHRHSCFYSEIRGSYLDADGVRRERMIPQPVLEANPYDSGCGHIMRIYVK